MPQVQGTYFEHNSTYYTSQAAEEKRALVSGAGKLAMLKVVNVSGGTVYLWVFDSLSASGTVLLSPTKLTTGQSADIVLPAVFPFGTGCYFASSSTFATYTATTAADLMVTAVTH